MEESDAPRFTLALKRGAILADRYRIDHLRADSSSFALTYLATDTSSSEARAAVAIKEFLPRVLVGRGRDDCAVQSHSPTAGREFARALRRFVHEGQVLADLENPYLIRVHQCFEENGTGYLVMTPRQGRSLPTALTEVESGCIGASEAVKLVLRLLEALEQIHAEGILHRHISPKAVAVTHTWQPTLHGFSARRHVSSEAPELAPGFAAFEQYGSGDIGPWTDVYASAALLYYLITGVTPPAAIQRAAGKPLAPAGWLATDVSPDLSQVIARGLSLMPEQRPHGVAEFRNQLESLTADAPNSASLDPRHSGALQLSADGAAPMLGDETERPRFARVLGAIAGRARDGLRSASAVLSKLKKRRVEARVDDAPSPAPLPELEKTPLALVAQAQEASPETAIEPISTSDSVEGEGQAWEIVRDERRRSVFRFVNVALVILAATAWTYRLVQRREVELVPAEIVAIQGGGAAGDSRAAKPVGPSGAAIRAGDVSSPVQQGTVSPADPTAARTTARRPDSAATDSNGQSAMVPWLPTIKRMNVTASIDTERRLVPVEVVLDLRTQLTNGKEQADQGQYALGRRIFASAVTAADAAINKFSGSENLRSLRAELDSADRRALRACQAENDLIRKRGGTVLPCE